MKELFQKMMKKLRKHSEAAGAIAALLLIVLFSGVMILGIRTQRESVPENPIDGMEKSSMVMLTGTKEVLAEQTKENGKHSSLSNSLLHAFSLLAAVILRNKKRKCITELLRWHIGKRIDLYRSSKGCHHRCAKAVDKPLYHKNSEIHYRLLYAGCRSMPHHLQQCFPIAGQFFPFGKK